MHRVRTDLSATLFLAHPDEYDGGELMVEDSYGVHHVEASSRSSGSLSFDEPPPRATGDARGADRLLLLDPEHGTRGCEANLTIDLDMAVQRLNQDMPEHTSTVQLTGVYHNLLRLWAEYFLKSGTADIFRGLRLSLPSP